VDQLLRELVEIANSVDGKGNHIFSGFRSKIEPFRVSTGRVEGSRDAEVVTSVQYVGDNGRNRAEIDEMATLDFRLPGNFVFWAERQQIYSSVESLNYRVQNDSAIRIDGVEIQLKEGDNLYAIIDKLNGSGYHQGDRGPEDAGIRASGGHRHGSPYYQTFSTGFSTVNYDESRYQGLWFRRCR